MTRRTAILVFCNKCGAPLPEENKLETLSRGRKTVEMDLCPTCTDDLDKVINVFFEIGTPPNKRPVVVAVTEKKSGGHHELVPAQCERCKTWFPNSQGCAAHLRACDGTQPEFRCPDPKCKTAFRKEYLLRKHVEAGVHVIPPARAVRSA